MIVKSHNPNHKESLLSDIWIATSTYIQSLLCRVDNLHGGRIAFNPVFEMLFWWG
jgi:hypothetical protein